MAERAGETILHGLVAAGVILALLRLWPGDPPGLRLRFQLMALASPAVLAPALWFLAPERASAAFHDEWALYSTRRLAQVRLAGLGLDGWLGGGLALAGSLLFLRDLGPFLLDRWGKTRHTGGEPCDQALVEVVREISLALGVAPPSIACVRAEGPLLLTVGLWRPRIVASRALLERLAPDELRAALAHEVAHVAKRDPLLGAGLMGLRALLFFNPAVQVMARAAVQEMERRADDVAVTATGAPETLVRGLLTGYREGEGRRTTARGWPVVGGLGRLLDRFRVHSIEARCRRLVAGAEKPAPPHGGVRLGLTSVALAALLYLVV